MNVPGPDSAPFTCTYTPQLPGILTALRCSLAITTYQAGKFVFISPSDNDRLTLLPRTFLQPMGFVFDGKRLALATREEVILFENSPELAHHYPQKPGVYDALFLPRVTYHTGMVDLHDIGFGDDGIWGVNTSFSCLCRINGEYNFLPGWRPGFVTDLVSEDRCHLNGMVIENGKPRWVTLLGKSDTPQGWREGIMEGGLLMDSQDGEILLDHLPMPHSPVLYHGSLYILLSATGDLIRVDPVTKSYEVIKRLGRFCRGLDICGDYAFIGLSRLRKNSSVFAGLPIARNSETAGILVLYLPTRSVVGEITFHTSIDEIYGLHVLSGFTRPNILNTVHSAFRYALEVPQGAFWGAIPESTGPHPAE